MGLLKTTYAVFIGEATLRIETICSTRQHILMKQASFIHAIVFTASLLFGHTALADMPSYQCAIDRPVSPSSLAYINCPSATKSSDFIAQGLNGDKPKTVRIVRHAPLLVTVYTPAQRGLKASQIEVVDITN